MKCNGRQWFGIALLSSLQFAVLQLGAQSLESTESTEKARALMAANQPAQANEMLSSLVASNLRRCADQVWVSFRTKDYSHASKFLKQAITYAPDYVSAHHYYALTLARHGETDAAKAEETIAQQLTEDHNKVRDGFALLPVPLRVQRDAA
jgi:hypothetical protein